MPPRRFTVKIIVGSACLGVLACLLSQGSKGVESKPAPGDDPPTGARTKIYMGVNSCIPCHEAGTQFSDPVARCNEFSVWKTEDKHHLAFSVLKNQRGKDIGIALKSADVTKDERCLSCHSANVGNDPQTPSFSLADGVSCTICHGSYKEWVKIHGDEADYKDWRKLARDVKEDTYGMTDLWHPAKRARLCASCHVGNTEQRKVITHEMYAAGHPPLPSFELETFGEAMHPHWELLGQKSASVRGRLEFVPGTLERTELVVVGGIATFQNSMVLLKTQAAKAIEEGERSKSAVPLDLAQYDCYACHHDLKNPSWRQQRNFRAKPGRVPMHSWPVALVRLGIRQAAGSDDKNYAHFSQEFDARLKRLTNAFNAQPYGNSVEIAKAAQDLVEWCDDLLKAIAKPPAEKPGERKESQYSRAAAIRLLRELCASPQTVDYESARQIAWAFKVIYNETHQGEGGPVGDVIKEIDKELNLTLPAGQDHEILKELNHTLSRMSAYQPDQFAKHLAELKALLEKEGLDQSGKDR